MENTDGLVTLDEESAVGLSHILHVTFRVREFCHFFMVKEVLAFYSNFARILVAFCSNFARIFPMTFVQNLGGGRKRSTDVLRQAKVQPISLTVEKEF